MGHGIRRIVLPAPGYGVGLVRIAAIGRRPGHREQRFLEGLRRLVGVLLRLRKASRRRRHSEHFNNGCDVHASTVAFVGPKEYPGATGHRGLFPHLESMTWTRWGLSCGILALEPGKVCRTDLGKPCRVPEKAIDTVIHPRWALIDFMRFPLESSIGETDECLGFDLTRPRTLRAPYPRTGLAPA
jgi:hypothetical protein